jgi:phage baseplate assembly protein W
MYVDINPSFKIHPITKDILKVTGADAIKRSILNLLKVSRYERLMNPNLGSRIRDYLFEPMNKLTSIRLQNAIEDNIRTFEPRAELVSVKVESIPEKNEYRLLIIFGVKDMIELIEFETFLTRIK